MNADADNVLPKNIILIGYRGAGKTAVGRILAKRLGRVFYDTDAYIEEKAGRTIADMVASGGWPFFRARERQAIEEISAGSNCVVATGGGAVMDPDNAGNLRRHGFVVLLTADVETLLRRICHDDATAMQRPSLLNCDIRQETERLLKERMPTYQRVSDFIVDTTNLDAGKVAENILARYEKGERHARQ